MSAHAHTQAYVFTMNPAGKSVLAGEMSLGRSGGQFTYNNDWLKNPNAYAIDPVNLPLQKGSFRCENPDGVFPVFADAAPDAWGKLVMLQRHKSLPKNEIERLLQSSGNGIGTLRFSLSRTRPKTPAAREDISLLARLAEATEQVERQEELQPEQLRLIEPGSSLGGARPKTILSDGQDEYIAKFSKIGDLIDIPRVEYASMSLLRNMGFNVPPVRLVSLSTNKSAFLIRRFDIHNHHVTHHYVSAHALFNINRIRSFADGRYDPSGYVSFAKIIRGVSFAGLADCKELYRRLIVNVLFCNTDDHARNHGITYDLNRRQWNLAPLFDVLPIITGANQEQALSIGAQGRSSTLENVLSVSESFGLSTKQALEYAVDIYVHLGQWQTLFLESGVNRKDIRIINRLLEPKLKEARITMATHGLNIPM